MSESARKEFPMSTPEAQRIPPETPKRIWGDAYYRALRKGYDHGAAAHAADQAEARAEKKGTR